MFDIGSEVEEIRIMQIDNKPRLPGDPVRLPNHREKAVVRFIGLQLFSLIYLQKLAVGPSTFQLSVSMLIMIVGLGWLIITGSIQFSRERFGAYALFAGLCLFSEAMAEGGGSIPSLLQLLILYSYMTVVAVLTDAVYGQLLDRFVKLMILPAALIIFQFVYQVVTGLSDPISMNRLLPESILLRGFIYEGPLHFGFSFMRPNGFFFLETSFASAFVAAAAIIELTYFKRPRLALFMLAATVLSLGGTGLVMLLAATPFLLARATPRNLGLVIVMGVAGLFAAHLMGVQLPLLSRVNELGTEGSSGSGRLLVPAVQFITLLTDPSYILRGTGAGSTSVDFGSAWPVVKILNEYGLLAMIAFVFMYICGVSDRFNLPLKFALSIAYNFTGGHLLNPIMVELLVLLCFIIAPVQEREAARRVVAPSGAAAGFELLARDGEAG